MPLSSSTLQVGRVTRLLGLGDTVVRWVLRGGRGAVVRRVCARTVAAGIAGDVLVGAAPELAKMVRGRISPRSAGRTVLRMLVISCVSAGVTAVVVTVTAGLSPPVQLVLLIICTVATAELESLLEGLLMPRAAAQMAIPAVA
jgi:hypothetical protein